MNNFNRNSRNNNMYNRNMQGNRQNGTANNHQTGNNQQMRSSSQQNNEAQSQPQGGNEQLDNLLNKASKHLNASPEELKKAAQSGNMQKLISNMSPSQAAQLEKILSDENAAKKLLSTPQAQALLRGLQKNE